MVSGRRTSAHHVPWRLQDLPGPTSCYGWQVTPTLGRAKPRRMYRIDGLCGTEKYGVHDNCLDNVLRGLYERVLFRVGEQGARQPLQPVGGAFEENLGQLRQQLVACTPKIRRVTRQKFVEMYDGRKRAVYQRAADSLSVRPLNVSDSFLSTFVKCEKIDFHTKPDPAPRVIQPRSPRYNVELGRYLKAHEKHVCKGIAELWGGPTVMKGMNAREQGAALRGMWDQFKRPVAVGLDASRFDQHVSVPALQFEHSCYLAMCPEPLRPRLAMLLDWQLRNRGFARVPDGTIKYEVGGRRMSGDMNTGLGNCLLMCLVTLGLKRRLGIPMRLANNGDDCVVICERRDLGKLMQEVTPWYGTHGFVMEVEKPVYQFEEISFCQTQPVWHEGWIMCRDPRVVVGKDLVSVLDLARGGPKWAHAIGTCGMSLAGGIPVLGALYAMLLSHSQEGKASKHPWLDTGFAMMARGLAGKDTPPTALTRLTFWRAFGILPDMQVAMENELRQFNLSFSAGVTNPTLHHVPKTYDK